MNPQLLIIGGPNGAGKSTFSKDLSIEGALIFDADVVIAKLHSKHPGWPKESLANAVQQEFLDNVDLALSHRMNFTIETNLRDWVLKDTIDRFRDGGYEVGLAFLCLPSVEQSMDRVTQRVKNGGHFVDNPSIRYNYEEGLKNLQFFADRFDHIEIFDASDRTHGLKSLLSIKNKELSYYKVGAPLWIREVIENVAGRFRDNDQNIDYDQDRTRRPRR